MKKQNFIIYGPSNSGKRAFTKDYCRLYEAVNLFCVDTREWKGYNTISVNELDSLKNAEDFANNLVIFDDIGDYIRMQVVDNFYSSGRHHNINIIFVGHTVTEINLRQEGKPPLYSLL